MAAEFTFLAGDERIEVRIIAFDASTTEENGDSDRPNSTVSVKVGAFSGSFKAVFTAQDLIILRDQLKNALVSNIGMFSFKNSGGDLSISIEFISSEAAILSGMIQPLRLPQGSLHFRLDIESSSLVRTVQELEDAILTFPMAEDKLLYKGQ